MKYSVICVHRNPMPHKRHRKKEKTSSNSNKSCEVWTTVPRALLKSTFFLLKLLLTLISFIIFRCVCALDVFFSLCFSTFFYHNLFNHHIWPYSVFLVSWLSCIRCLFYHQPTVFVVVGVVVTTVVSFFSFPPFFLSCAPTSIVSYTRTTQP